MRARDAGLFLRSGPTGPHNAITDVPGVAVGNTTLIAGDGPRVVGSGPVRTGVTVVLPHRRGPLWADPVVGGVHRLNGNGEMTGTQWIAESGLLASPIGLTNTHSVGIVHDALVRYEARTRPADAAWWALPVVAETWDGLLNDINGGHVSAAHVWDALEAAASGVVAEGAIGSGTGMIAFGFKAGIGTASRLVATPERSYTLGALVQANHGDRQRLSLDGLPVGAILGQDEVPLPDAPSTTPAGAGSIITVLATDAPLLPHQCSALAARAALGIGRVGGAGEIWSGDLSIAFATGNRDLPVPAFSTSRAGHRPIETIEPDLLSGLYAAAVDATEEAIANALFAAEPMTGCDGVFVHALPKKRVQALVTRVAGALR